MKKILITLLAALAVGAQAQQHEQFAPQNPNWHPHCAHLKVGVHDVRNKFLHQAMFEYCPGYETPELEMQWCVHLNDDKTWIRCYHSAYFKQEYVSGKLVRACVLDAYGRSNSFYLRCTEPKRYSMPSMTKQCASFSNC